MLGHNPFLYRLRTLVLGIGLGHIITILATPILTRLYSVEQFGVMAIYLAGIQVLRKVVCLRYEGAILIPENDKDASPVLVLSLAVPVILTLAIVAIMLVIEGISPSIVVPDYAVSIIPITIMIVGINQALVPWLNRMDHNRAISLARIADSLITVTVQMLLAGTDTGLLIGIMAGIGAGNIVLLITTYVKRTRFYMCGITNISSSAKIFRHFPLVTMWSGIINILSNRIPIILFSGLFGATVTGYYGLCHRVLSAPSALIGQAAIMAISKTAIDAHQTGKGMKNTVEYVVRILFILGSIPFLAITLFGQSFFSIVFGHQWLEAGEYSQILAPMLLIRFILAPPISLLTLIGKHNIYFLWSICKLVIIAFAIYFAYLTYESVTFTLVVFSICNAFILIVGMLWTMRATGASVRGILGL